MEEELKRLNRTSRAKHHEKTEKRVSPRILVINLAIIAFAVYATFFIINQKIQLSQKISERDSVQEEIVLQDIKNEEINNVAAVVDKLEDGNTDPEEYKESLSYIERVARELYDYIKQGERIYVNIAGE